MQKGALGSGPREALQGLRDREQSRAEWVQPLSTAWLGLVLPELEVQNLSKGNIDSKILTGKYCCGDSQ